MAPVRPVVLDREAGTAQLCRPDRGDLLALVLQVLTAVTDGAEDRGGPVPTGDPERLTADVRAQVGDLLAESGAGTGALGALTRLLARGVVDLADPAWSAHLLSPPLAVAVAADIAATVLNADLTSWDQSPAGIVLENEVVAAMCRLVGYDPATADGVVTSGGTESNLMGLLLARDRPEVRAATGRRLILASRAAHFTIGRNAGVLGFAASDVVEVDTDGHDRMRPAALDAALAVARAAGDTPVCVVGTAGTTDLGAIDPLEEVIDIAHRYGAPVHVDAAYGGGALLSDRLAPLLAGIGRADTVSLDLHKFGWQPIGAGVLLARSAAFFAPLSVHVPYVNAADDLAAGHLNLLGKSLRTTRRADAFKIAVTLRTLGRRRLGAMVEECHDLAGYAAARIAGEPCLVLACAPFLSTVVFRYRPDGTDVASSDRVNAGLRRRLLSAGTAVIGRTHRTGAQEGTWLKLTLLNPEATAADLDRLIDQVLAAGAEETGGRR